MNKSIIPIFLFLWMIMVFFYLKTSQHILFCGINKWGFNLQQQEGASLWHKALGPQIVGCGKRYRGPRLRAAARSTGAPDCGCGKKYWGLRLRAAARSTGAPDCGLWHEAPLSCLSQATHAH